VDTVLVTGAAGFAGSHLLELLAADAGTRLIAWRRPGGNGHDTGAWSRALVGRVTWRAVDLLDRSAVRAAVADASPSVVYHCAGAAHVGKAWRSTEPTFAVNVRGTHHLIEALRETGARAARVVIPSSSLVYEAAPRPLTESDRLLPVSPYGLSKLAQEMVGTENKGGPEVLIARAFTHIGPRQDPWFAASGFARRIADIEAGHWAPEIQVGNLEAQRDLTDVRDTVRAYRLIAHAGRPGRVYNVCSGRALPIRRVLELLLARARQPIAIAVDPNRYRPNDHPLVVGDPARIHTELGWSAQIPIEQALDDLLDYWRTRVREPSATGRP
jgi:GDP-4-dehydro-6-deoxy-D-mannose reductase